MEGATSTACHLTFPTRTFRHSEKTLLEDAVHHLQSTTKSIHVKSQGTSKSALGISLCAYCSEFSSDDLLSHG